MRPDNEEILRFANWWICSKYRPGWIEKREEFLNIVNDFQKNGVIKIIIVDQYKNGSIENLVNIPYYTPGNFVCCVYEERKENDTEK